MDQFVSVGGGVEKTPDPKKKNLLIGRFEKEKKK
jgi:hypothetical protein